MRHDRDIELPHGEALAHLRHRRAHHAALLRGARCAESGARRLLFRGQPRRPACRRQQPGVAIAGEDHVGEHVAHRVPDNLASAIVERGQPAREKRPREHHMALPVAGDQPQRSAPDLILRMLQVAEIEVEVELIVERAERGDECFDR
jgi:hypothetical protein